MNPQKSAEEIVLCDSREQTTAIVERLRLFASRWHRSITGPMGWLKFPEHYNEAANEIERLVQENATICKRAKEAIAQALAARDAEWREKFKDFCAPDGEPLPSEYGTYAKDPFNPRCYQLRFGRFVPANGQIQKDERQLELIREAAERARSST